MDLGLDIHSVRHPILSTDHDMLILVSSLLFTNRPSSNHLLSKGKAHFLSFVLFSVLWFGELSPVSEKLITLTGITVLACMWTIPAGLECSPDAFRNGHAQVWCGFTISEAVLGWLLFSLCKPNTLPPSSSDIIYLITKMALPPSYSAVNGFHHLQTIKQDRATAQYLTE